MIKRIIALMLALSMLFTIPTFAGTLSTGVNDNTVYLSLSYLDYDSGEPTTSVKAGESFFVRVGFSGNPTVKSDSIMAYALFVENNTDKAEAVECWDGDTTNVTGNVAYSDGVTYVAWMSEKGIVVNKKIIATGTLTDIEYVAKTNLTEADLKEIKLLAECDGARLTFKDGNDKTFTVVSLPTMEVGAVSGDIYSDTTAAQIKNMISSIKFIDVTGTEVVYTKADAEWANLSVSLPAGGLKGGKENTLTASFNGYDCEFTVNVIDRVESIAITTAPTKTVYEVFQTFDKTGMAVTATYESGVTEDVTASVTVDTTTELQLTDTSWTVEYEGKTANQAITVNKADIVGGITDMAKKYTATYSDLGSSASLTGKKGEAVTASITWYMDSRYISEAEAEAEIALKGDVGTSKTLYYKATGMTNYNDYWGKVAVTVEDKDIGSAEWTTVPSGWTYTEANKTAKVTYSKEGYIVSNDWFTVKSLGGAELGVAAVAVEGTTDNKVADVGTYNVLVLYEDKNNVVSETFTVIVEPASIEGKAVSLNNPTIGYEGAEITVSVTGVEDLAENDYEVAPTSVLSATNVGEYTVTVTGKGNYTGTASATWKITPAEITVSNATVAEKVYNGQTNDANVTSVTFAGLKGTESLEFGVDYTVTSANYANKNVGDPVSVTGTVALVNNAKTANYELGSAEFTTTGKITKAAAPSLSATAAQTLLSESVVDTAKDYSFNLASIVSGIPADAGEVTYAVKTEGTYVAKTGTGIDGSTLKVTVANAQVAGITDSVVVTVSSANYEDSDVTVNFEFKNKINVTVGLSDVNVTYGDAYTVEGIYANQPATGYTWTYTYTGIDGTDYAASSVKPVNPGKYTVTASYEDNVAEGEIPGHVGSVTATITVNKKALTIGDGDVTITKVYDGSTDAGVLSGALALDGKVGTDDVSIDMTNVVVGAYGSATVGTYPVEIAGITLTGADKDNYTVASTYTFANAAITKQIQDAIAINGISENIEYSTETVAITLGGGSGTGDFVLTSSDDSVLSVAGNGTNWTATILKAGTVTLTATKAGDNNYEPKTLEVTVVINPKAIADGDFTIDLTDRVYAAGEIKPEITSALAAGTDYDVAYSNNVNVGTATITITGKNNYTDGITKNFAIIPKDINSVEFEVTGLTAEYTYTGAEIEPAFELKWGDIVLADADYDTAYSDNVDAGVATITVTGSSNYTGSMSVNFNIVPAEYTGVVTITADTANIEVGTVLTANAPAGGTLSYQWKNNGVDIEDATSATYTVATIDAGADITVAVTSAGNYSGTIESAAVGVGKMILTGSVEITGTTDLVANVTGAPAAENYDIIWLRDGVSIEDATGANYTVADEDKGHTISVKIVAKGTSYTGEVVSTNAVAVPAEVPSFDADPVVSVANGSVTVELNATANGAEIMSYQVYLDGTLVDTVAGTETSYTITGLTNNQEYAIKVVAVNSVGSTESNEVKATPKVLSTGGGGSRTYYDVKVSKVEGGVITANTDEAFSPQVVKFEVVADDGYKLSEVSVVSKSGKDVKITKNGDAYTFVMPSGDVTISAEFTKIGEIKDDEPDDPIVEPDDKEFEDVDVSTYYYDAVKWAVENSVTSGMNEKEFGPDVDCTRAQMVTFLWRSAGSPKVEAENPFEDVSKDSYYYNAVLWAIENDITLGVSETAFAPNDTVSRAQTVTFLWRLAKTPSVEAENPFVDVEDGAYYSDAVLWAVKNNVTQGISSIEFAPSDVCTRAQIVTFMYRYFVK